MDCPHCQTPAEEWQRFCGSCGSALAKAQEVPVETAFFTPGQADRRAKLLVVRGDAPAGTAFYLSDDEHRVGRSEGDIVLADDPYVGDPHARFVYRDGKLYVEDLGAANGVYLRIRQPIPLGHGDRFLAGEQLLELRLYRPADTGDAREQFGGERFCGTPLRPWRLQLVQWLDGGAEGLVYATRKKAVTLGRDGQDLSFPYDPYISGSHCRVEDRDGEVMLVDAGSRNGTFFRLAAGIPVGLQDGDHLFIGRQLLRVETL